MNSSRPGAGPVRPSAVEQGGVLRALTKKLSKVVSTFKSLEARKQGNKEARKQGSKEASTDTPHGAVYLPGAPKSVVVIVDAVAAMPWLLEERAMDQSSPKRARDWQTGEAPATDDRRASLCGINSQSNAIAANILSSADARESMVHRDQSAVAVHRVVNELDRCAAVFLHGNRQRLRGTLDDLRPPVSEPKYMRFAIGDGDGDVNELQVLMLLQLGFVGFAHTINLPSVERSMEHIDQKANEGAHRQRGAVRPL